MATVTLETTSNVKPLDLVSRREKNEAARRLLKQQLEDASEHDEQDWAEAKRVDRGEQPVAAEALPRLKPSRWLICIFMGTTMWRHTEDKGLMTSISEMISKWEQREASAMPDFPGASTILAVSDYSGEHPDAAYHVLSFLLVDLDQFGEWEQNRLEIRRIYLRDKRRMAFKNLNDKRRRDAFFPFLNAANSLPGICISVAVHRSVRTMFVEDGLDTNSDYSVYPHWPVGTFEKVMRIAHFLSLFVAGLSYPNQNLMWITDHDAITANPKRFADTQQIFQHILSHYLPHNLGHIRIGTSANDNGTGQIEDLIAIPDLMGGALSEVLTSTEETSAIPSAGLLTPLPNSTTTKSAWLSQWFSLSSQPLKRLLMTVSVTPQTKDWHLRILRFEEVPEHRHIILPK